MFLYGNWLRLPLATRHKIADMFGIKRKGSIEVFNNMIKSDGYDIHDIETILNIGILEEKLGYKFPNFEEAWKTLVDFAEGRETEETKPLIKPVVVIEEPEAVEEPIIRKRGRPKKN